MATAPECNACYCENCYVKCIPEIEVMPESFKVVYGDWVFWPGGWRGDFGGALVLRSEEEDCNGEIKYRAYSESAVQ